MNAIENLEVSREFTTMSEAKLEVSKYLLTNGIKMSVIACTKTDYRLKCNKRYCPAFIKISMSRKSGLYVVRNMVHHKKHKKRQKKYCKAMKPYLIHLVTENGLLKCSEHKHIIFQQTSLHLTDRIVRSCMKLSKETIYGMEKNNFSILCEYLAALCKENVGSSCLIKKDESNRFYGCFLAPSASIHALKHVRPVISLDASHLKNKWKGNLFFASAKDSEDHIVPLAFGLVADTENKESWEIFLKFLKTSFEINDNMMFISDKDKGILPAMNNIFPQNNHLSCTFHISQNVKGRFGKEVSKFVNSLSVCKSEMAFLNEMEKLKSVNTDAFEYISSLDLKAFVDCYVPDGRFDFYTSNISESLNGTLFSSRKESYLVLANHIVMKMSTWFAKRFQKSTKMYNAKKRHKLTKSNKKKLKKNWEAGEKMKVTPISEVLFLVAYNHDGNKTIKQRVNINANTINDVCKCGVVRQFEFACAHVCAVFYYLGKSIKYVERKYCSYWYTREALKSTYEIPIVDVSIPTTVKDEILVPKLVSQRGRPKEKRIKNKFWARSVNCIPGSNDVKEKIHLKKYKPVRRCRKCNRTGHNIRTCSKNGDIHKKDKECCNFSTGFHMEGCVFNDQKYLELRNQIYEIFKDLKEGYMDVDQVYERFEGSSKSPILMEDILKTILLMENHNEVMVADNTVYFVFSGSE